jgi:dTDP-4-amino-4,6-dideoxygalactose transaminase
MPTLNQAAIVPLVDLEAQHRTLREPIEAAALRVLRSGRYCLGPEVQAFEDAFAQYCEAAYAVGVNSGTSALQLALFGMRNRSR